WEIFAVGIDVGYLRYCGPDLLRVRLSAHDPNVWSGRALQEVFVDPADTVLHQCIRPLLGALCSGPSWISARMRSDYRTGLERGHLGHQCSHAPGRPILHR